LTTFNTRPIVSLCFRTDPSFERNLEHLVGLISQSPKNAIIVAPEVCLSGFAYEHFDEAAAFTEIALERLQSLIDEQLLIFTAITKRGGEFYNIAYALHKNAIFHQQGKVKLFSLSGENNHFSPEKEKAIAPFEWCGLKIGILICFELRFKTLWQQLEGCDLIAVPAQWGKLRSDHFVTLTNALALMNQCYVIASDAANEETSAMSGIVTPFGGEIRNNGAEYLTSQFEERTLQSMRRYLDVGITRDR